MAIYSSLNSLWIHLSGKKAQNRNSNQKLTNASLVIWAVLDPANPFVAAAGAPFVIGIAYANMIWGFADVTISTNLARDLGTRIVAAIFWGGDAFNRYAAIAIFVNIPATFLATCVYELILRDSFAIIGQGHNVHEEGEEGLARHLTKTGTLDGTMEQGMGGNIAQNGSSDTSYRGKTEDSVV